MNFRGPFATIQAVLKPHALMSLFGMDARALTNGSTTLSKLRPAVECTQGLEGILVATETNQDRVALLARCIQSLLTNETSRDRIVEESIALISQNIGTISVKFLIGRLGISERQFEKRFTKTVGIPPKLYIRIARINEAFRLMGAGKFERLSDLAQELNFFDQSHFIREVKAFSGITPKSIAQKVSDFRSDFVASSYTIHG